VARPRGSYNLAQSTVERSFRRELQRQGYEPGARLAQMCVERKNAGDWRGELTVMELVRRWVTPITSPGTPAPGQGTLTLEWNDGVIEVDPE